MNPIDPAAVSGIGLRFTRQQSHATDVITTGWVTSHQPFGHPRGA